MKVVTAKEMSRIENLAYEEGFSEKQFMEAAGRQVANVVHRFCQNHHIAKEVFCLIGKGNNGGDGYVAGIELLQKGYKVKAYLVAEVKKSSSLNQFFHKEFLQRGGEICFFARQEGKIFSKKGIVIDALLGTGFKGEVKPPYLTLIQKANQSGLPVIAIDVPSGLDATNGKVCGESIVASCTVFLGLAKKGFFFNDGWNVVGKLEYGDFGLPQKYIEKGREEATLFVRELVKLPKLSRKRHKYQAGYVLAIAGSKGMSGAAKLSAFAALRSGAGIVRMFYPEEISNEMINAPFELICSASDFKKIDPIEKEINRAKAIFIGPGLGREAKTQSFLENLIGSLKIPAIFDADALYLCSHLSWPKHAILTPHHREMMHLLNIDKVADEEDLFERSKKYAKEKGVILVLKGAPTMIFHPEKQPVIVPHGDPGMATAGAGDVLTGVLSAIASQGVEPYQAAMLGVFIHALAGEKAAREKSAYAMIASDIIQMLPNIFQRLQDNRT